MRRGTRRGREPSPSSRVDQLKQACPLIVSVDRLDQMKLDYVDLCDWSQNRSYRIHGTDPDRLHEPAVGGPLLFLEPSE